ncbi:MAG TPA: hypothetical protein VLM39_10685, partial [Ignavibacteriaceae bacterium]|nr:hypothetical protein [Ignavibacteriaceae bacterium]
MKRLSLLFIIFLPLHLYPESIRIHITNKDSLYDVFPLRPGIKYSYGFLYEGSSGDYLISTTVKDSGQIEYLVIDSTSINDSLRIWNVIEIHNYNRYSSSSMPPGVDTSYYVGDSTEFELYENLWGKHELSCFTKIWWFPLHHNNYQTKESIYRYIDTTEVRLDWKWYDTGGLTGGTGFDTVWFSSEYGFKGQRFQENWHNPLYFGHNSLTVQALHAPLAVDERNNNIHQPKRLHLKQNYPNPFNP